MSSHSKNSSEYFYGKSMYQRSNDPTKGLIKIYNVLFLYFMFVSLCWNVVFVLEHVGIRISFFRYRVGTKKVFRKMLECSNIQAYIKNQTDIRNNGLLLVCWYVGAGNDHQTKIKKIMKTNQYGDKYYDKLPDGYRLATINDFILNGKLNLRMEFLIKWVSREYYQVCVVSANLKSAFLLPFIEDKRVFVKN